jgi:glycosyltransferase involved in cell wall biosynthesis
MVIVDDGSTDKSLAIARSFAQEDSRIEVFEKHHSGVADTLNYACARSVGAYIALLDQDDLAMPTRLAEQVAFLDASPECAVVGSHATMIDEQGAPLGRLRRPTADQGLSFASMLGENLIIDSSAMMRRSIFDAVGGYRTLKYPGAQDYDLWLRISRFYRMENLPMPLIALRIHTEQASFTGLAAQVLSVMEARANVGTDDRASIHVKAESAARKGEQPFDPRSALVKRSILRRYLEYASFYIKLERMENLAVVLSALREYSDGNKCNNEIECLLQEPEFAILRVQLKAEHIL